MEWPSRKRIFYAELMQSYHRQQQQAQQAVEEYDAAGDVDVESLLDEADTHVPNQSDVNVPTPSQTPPTGTSTGHATTSVDANIDGKRITRRQTDEPEQRQLFDPSQVHPAVRRHGNVIRVRGDDEPADTQAGDLDGDDADADSESDA